MMDSDQLLHQLSKLPYQHNIAFAAACCERLVPIYQAFVLVEQWGDFDVLQMVLDQVWASLEKAPLKEEHIHNLKEVCKKVVPHSEDFDSIFVGGSINAYAAIIHTLDYYLDKDFEHIISITNLTIETIDEYVFAVNNPYMYPTIHTPAIDEWIQSSPLMIAELEKQKEDLEILKTKTILDADFLEELRISSCRVGIHPIQRGLVVISDDKSESD